MEKDEKRKKLKIEIKKGDLFIVPVVLLVAGISFFWMGMQGEGDLVRITVKGEVSEYRLSQNRVIRLENGESEYNTVVIRNREVHMENASCPDKVCVRHKAVSKNGERIICLPNEVFIEVEGFREKETDN
ncbi:MAG: NusG domain II-containing protein [Bacteroidales bacterium]|nr:NusG domain II-containing protein [Clostridium sp.]MCM1202702.1 NusG domain II-containing protein [Bacteroidales bacterium]